MQPRREGEREMLTLGRDCRRDGRWRRCSTSPREEEEEEEEEEAEAEEEEEEEEEES